MLVSLVLGGAICAQNAKKAKPDFSGTWLLKSSENAEDKIFKPKPVPKDPTTRKTSSLRIEHSDPELKLIDVLTTEGLDQQGNVLSKADVESKSRLYYTDKRGETNQQKSTTKWEGSNIIIATVDDNNRTAAVVKLSLSKDQKELTITTMTFLTQYDSASQRDYVLTLPMGGKKVYIKI